MTAAPVVVVGAGVAGLCAARELSARTSVTVLDKGRGVGGRLATRRSDGASFDHGAQFVTTRSEWFTALVDDARSAGVVREWFRGEVGPDGPSGTGHPRWCGVGGISALAKHLALGLDVRTSTRVTSLTVTGDAWVVRTETATLEASALVLTAPVPQTLDLLAAGGVGLADDDARALGSIAYEPCTAVMAVLRRPVSALTLGPTAPGGDVVAWVADNAGKGASAVPAVTVHTTAAFAEHSWETPAAELADTVLRAAGIDLAEVDGDAQVHRWRYARPTVLHGADHLRLAGLPPAVLAGDAFGGPLVEGAALSGRAAARALLG